MNVTTARIEISQNKFIAARAVLALFARQTSDEKSDEVTKWDNAVGFNAADGRKLSVIAKKLWTKVRPGVTEKPKLDDFGYIRAFDGQWVPGTLEKCLWPEEWDLLHDRLPKYARQLVK